MDPTALFSHRNDPYPRLSAWRKFQAALHGPEACVLRFFFILLRLRHFCKTVNDVSELDEMLAELSANLAAGGGAKVSKWRATQAEAIACLQRFRQRQKGESFTVKRRLINQLNRITRRRGLSKWADRNVKPFLKRLNALSEVSAKAVGKVRVRRCRSEIKAGASVLVESTFEHEYITLKVGRVSGDRATLGDGSHAVFEVTPGGKFSQPYGQWRIKDGKYKGRSIRAEMPLDRVYIAAQLGLVTPDLQIQKSSPSQVIDPAFQAQLVDGVRVQDMAAGGTMTLDDVGESVLPKVTHGSLATYLIRRFGYPQCGTDDYKELMGAWQITTPEPGLIIQISPLASGSGYGLWYGLTAAASREVRAATDLWWRGLRTRTGQDADKAVTVVARYYRAARIALADLMRPVQARDQWITAEGVFDESKGQYNDDGLIGGVPRDTTCNYGIDRRTLEHFAAHKGLLNAVAKMGPDFEANLKRATEMLTK